MTLTIHQRVFVIESYFKTGSIKQTQQDFNAEFPGVNVPVKNAIQKLVKKFRDTGSVLNKKKLTTLAEFAIRKLRIQFPKGWRLAHVSQLVVYSSSVECHKYHAKEY